MHLDEAFPGHVFLEVFRHVLGEVVRVMLLHITNIHGGTVSVADPGSGAFLTSEFGIRNRDQESQMNILDNFSDSLETIFWTKKTLVL